MLWIFALLCVTISYAFTCRNSGGNGGINVTGNRELECVVHPLGSLGSLRFVVVCSFYNGKMLLSYHKGHSAWETQGGHIEPGETPDEAAARELYEESGARDARIIPVCDYYAYDSHGSANGRVYAALISEIDPLPPNEMSGIGAFDAFPDNLTYPRVTPVLFEAARRALGEGGALSIRLAAIGDYDAMYALWCSTEQSKRALNPVDDSREGIARYLTRNPNTCFVACAADGAVVGVILSGHDGRRGIIHHMCVHPDYRRRGIAGRLVSAAEQALRGEGISKVFGLVFKDNDPANAFWEAQGYTLRTNLNYRNKSLNADVPQGE